MNRFVGALKALTALPPWPEREIVTATKSVNETAEAQIDAVFLGGAPSAAITPTPLDLLTIATVHRCMSRRANDTASAPIVIEEKQGKDWVPVEPGEANYSDVAGVFDRANAYEGRTQMWARFFQSLLLSLTGDAYLFTDYMNEGRPPGGSDAPKELHVLTLGGVTPIWPTLRQPFEGPLGYRYSSNGAVIPNIRPDEIYRHVNPSPLGPFLGLSLVQALALDALTERDIGQFQREFFLNGARGSVAILNDKPMTEDQRNEFRASWREDQATLGKRQGLWLLTGGLKPVEMNNRKDGDFPELAKLKKQQICMVLGVPPSFVADYGDSGVRANLEEQTPQYVDGTLEPDWTTVEQGLTEIVLPRFAHGERGLLRARFDRDRVPMIQRMAFERNRAFPLLVGRPVMSVNEARDGMHLPAKPGYDDLADPVQAETMGAPVTESPEAKAKPPGKGPGPRKPAATPPAAGKTARVAMKWIDEPNRHARRALKAATFDVMERPALAAVKNYFSAREEAWLSRLPAQKSRATKDMFDGIWDGGEEEAAARDLILTISAKIAHDRGPEATAEVGGDPASFLLDDPRIVAFLHDNAYSSGKKITGTTADMLREAIAEAVASGGTIGDVAQAIKDVAGVRRASAMTIARTEVVRANNMTSMQAWAQTGLVEKVSWLTAHDDAVRSIDKGDEYDHAAMDGVEVGLGEKFSVPGANGPDELEYPGDPNGDAADVINCRCVPEPVQKSYDADPARTVAVSDALEKIFA